MIGGIRLKNVVEKADKGEKLSPSEEKLLDAAVTNMAVNAYYSSDLGRGYKAGQTTGASIPFMLEFAINPISAAGEGIAKSILKYGMKKFGASAMKKGMSKWGTSCRRRFGRSRNGRNNRTGACHRRSTRQNDGEYSV